MAWLPVRRTGAGRYRPLPPVVPLVPVDPVPVPVAPVLPIELPLPVDEPMPDELEPVPLLPLMPEPELVVLPSEELDDPEEPDPPRYEPEVELDGAALVLFELPIPELEPMLEPELVPVDGLVPLVPVPEPPLEL